MTKKIGVRELARNIKVLDEYDILEIEDKKTKRCKGVFVSSKYANEVKEFIENKEKESKERKLRSLMQFAGTIQMDEGLEQLDEKSLRKEAARRKIDEI